MPYTNDQISGFINSQGIANNPYAIYTNAQKYGVTGDQLDQAMGWGAGTANNWIQQQGLQGLNGAPVTGATPNVGSSGYATAPGATGSPGYYEQQTPAGSFAAVDPSKTQPTAQATNPYIGATTTGVGNAPSVMPWAQMIADFGKAINPYLGRATQQVESVGPNPYAQQSNPYLQQNIDAATQDITRNFNSSVIPGLDALDRASGSFGNSALQEVRGNAYRDLGSNIANTAGRMRMEDYNQRANLTEQGLNRELQTRLANAGYNAGDLSRNLSGFNTQQQTGMQGMGSLLTGATTDAGNNLTAGVTNANLRSGDLTRNTNAAHVLSTFNAGETNAANRFNTGQTNAINTTNAGAANNMLGQARNLGETGRQFNENMDFNTWKANTDLMNTGSNAQMNALATLLGWNQGGVTNATTIQNTPLQYLQQLFGLGTAAGGTGGTSTGTGTNSQDLQGNQFLGGLGGLLAALQLFGGLGNTSNTGTRVTT